MQFDPELERRLQKAEEAVQALKPEFAKSMETDLKAIDEILARLDLDESDYDALDRLRALIHELKGNAGSFDFPLVSMIAECFQALLRALNQLNKQLLGILRDHRNTLEIAMKPTLSANERTHLNEFVQLSRQLSASL